MHTQDQYDKDAAYAAFDRIARLTRENGGGTFRRETGAPVTLTTGYTVGVGNIAQVGIGLAPDLTNVATILGYYWPKTAPANAQYIGTWVDSNLLYIDHVTVISDLDIALALARRNNERSIYDNARGICIDVSAE
jgi:hypothetical protein